MDSYSQCQPPHSAASRRLAHRHAGAHSAKIYGTGRGEQDRRLEERTFQSAKTALVSRFANRSAAHGDPRSDYQITVRTRQIYDSFD